jgi:spermidine/putrescine transport system permease protein
MTVKNTLLLAGISTVIATLIGTLLGYGLARHEFFGKRGVSRLLMIPIAIPDIVMAVSLLLFFAIVRRFVSWLEPGLVTMIIAHVTFQIPFVAVVVRARLDGFENHIEEAASDLGASRWQRIWHVTIPMLGPGILAGALLAFTLSLDDFVVSFFTSGAGSTTVPIYIYSSVKRGLTGEIHALSSMMILAAILGTAAITWVQWRSTKKLITPHRRNPSQAQKLEEKELVFQNNP